MFLSKLQTILLLIVVGLILPIYVNAFLEGPIVPCGTRNTSECTLCDIFKMGQNIINFIWELIIVIVPIFILAGGIMILTAGAKPDQVGLGKKIIFNAIIGMVIAFLSWTIINMVFNTLVGEGKKEGFPWPWNEIQCKVSEGEKPPIVKEGEYCVCETPVYDLDPNQFPDAEKIATEAKVTKLADKDTCKERCHLQYFNEYCTQNLKPEETKMYCASEAGLKSVKACGVGLKEAFECRISNQGFAKTDPNKNTCIGNSDCLDLVTPGSNKYDRNLASKCWLDGQLICGCVEKGGDKPCFLYSYKEIRQGGISTEEQASLWDCRTYTNKNDYCRKDCKYNECSSAGTTAQWCQRAVPSGSDKWILSGINEKQKGDASPALVSFLNCMYGKIPNLKINSISEDALCQNPSCNTITQQCGSHGINACHYGGENCTGMSYSVDFNTDISCSQIKVAAKQCDSNPWINWETNHTHITIGYGMSNCDCVDSTYGPGKSCP